MKRGGKKRSAKTGPTVRPYQGEDKEDSQNSKDEKGEKQAKAAMEETKDTRTKQPVINYHVRV